MYNYTIREGSMEEKTEEAKLLQATATGRLDATEHPVPDAAQTARRTPGDECYSGRTTEEHRTSPKIRCHFNRT